MRRLHAAGIEVILDVVYNHTAEGNELGPTLSFRGIDNASYYRLVAGQPAPLHQRHRQRQHAQPAPSARAADGDGFAALLGRRVARRRLPLRPRRRRSAARRTASTPARGFFDALRAGPVLSRVKLIAEPWDLGPGGYQLGNFPPGWAEWNDRFRDSVRALLARRRRPRARSSRRASRARATCSSGAAGGPGPASTTSPRTTASRCRPRQLRRASTTRPTARTTATATTTTCSWNCGVEGPTDDPGDPATARAPCSATCSPRCSARTGHADAARRATSSAAPSAATTTPTARTTRLRWLDWTLARAATAGAARLRARA